MAHPHTDRNRAFIWTGLGIALLIAIFLSPFASSNPDGLDRVSEDHGFGNKAAENTPAQKLPFYSIFDEYALRSVPEGIATPLAGLVGTLAAFGLAWGAGKLLVKGFDPNRPEEPANPDPHDRLPR
jgi:cobalt/nickel transport protein